MSIPWSYKAISFHPKRSESGNWDETKDLLFRQRCLRPTYFVCSLWAWPITLAAEIYPISIDPAICHLTWRVHRHLYLLHTLCPHHAISTAPIHVNISFSSQKSTATGKPPRAGSRNKRQRKNSAWNVDLSRWRAPIRFFWQWTAALSDATNANDQLSVGHGIPPARDHKTVHARAAESSPTRASGPKKLSRVVNRSSVFINVTWSPSKCRIQEFFQV